MKEYGLSVLEQYHIEVSSTRKIRGAILCDTNEGLLLLKEAAVSEKRVPMLYKLCRHLQENGYERVDQIIPNEAGNLVSVGEDGAKYLMKRWFNGRECDIKKDYEVLEATKNLARLHKIMEKPLELEPEILPAQPPDQNVLGEIMPDGGEPEKIMQDVDSEEISLEMFRGNDLREEFQRHNRELKKVRGFIRNRVSKGDFELAFLKHFDSMYQWADAVTSQLMQSNYGGIYEDSIKRQTFTHGDYNYHNVMMTSNGMATSNFDHFHIDVQVSDLYYFLRKVMEKHLWNEKLGDNILSIYNGINPLGSEDMEYMALRLAYPEKFWKVANTYYHSNKAWIPVKSVEKLQVTVRQVEEKRLFLQNIFSFHL